MNNAYEQSLLIEFSKELEVVVRQIYVDKFMATEMGITDYRKIKRYFNDQDATIAVEQLTEIVKPQLLNAFPVEKGFSSTEIMQKIHELLSDDFIYDKIHSVFDYEYANTLADIDLIEGIESDKKLSKIPKSFWLKMIDQFDLPTKIKGCDSVENFVDHNIPGWQEQLV